jgi:sulfur-oxidizing protein SoxY
MSGVLLQFKAFGKNALLQPEHYSDVLEETLKGQSWIESAQIRLEVPQVAENGAIVPISIESLLPNTHRILVFSEHNPGPRLAEFEFFGDADPWVSLRLKLNASGTVLALAESEGHFYGAEVQVKVMVGGCG